MFILYVLRRGNLSDYLIIYFHLNRFLSEWKLVKNSPPRTKINPQCAWKNEPKQIVVELSHNCGCGILRIKLKRFDGRVIARSAHRCVIFAHCTWTLSTVIYVCNFIRLHNNFTHIETCDRCNCVPPLSTIPKDKFLVVRRVPRKCIHTAIAPLSRVLSQI